MATLTRIAGENISGKIDCLELEDVRIYRVADIDDIAWPARALFSGLTDEEMLEAEPLLPPGALNAARSEIRLSFNSFLIQAPNLVALIDAGIGNGKERLDRPAWHRRSGAFLSDLEALGFPPDRIDLVINTHLHADHVGWNTVSEGLVWRPTFRRARYVVPIDELKHWLGLNRDTPAGTILHGAFADSVQPLLDAGVLDAVPVPSEVGPGLRLQPAPGHSPGMAVVRLTFGKRSVLFLADVVHHPLQLGMPHVGSNFCVDPVQARTTRDRILADSFDDFDYSCALPLRIAGIRLPKQGEWPARVLTIAAARLCSGSCELANGNIIQSWNREFEMKVVAFDFGAGRLPGLLEGDPVMSLRRFSTGAITAVMVMLASAAFAQTPVKIGVITSLSGPGGYLGQDIRDGFQLAIDMGGGKLGDIPVQVVAEDDAAKPGQGKQIADRLLKNEHIKIFTGIVFSNVAGATVPDIIDADAIYVSPNAGPSTFAGKGCNPNYFVVSWQNDSLHESAGQLANELGYKSVYLVAANYQAGKDALEGFKRFYKGKVAGESFTRLDQTDFAAECADPCRRPRRSVPVRAWRPRHCLSAAVRAGWPKG